MTQFDLSLRQALMDANLAQYERVLQNADSADPDFSPAYLRERMRLLADPWGWMKRRERNGPRRRTRLNWRVIAIAAALLLLSACAYVVVTGQFSQWFPRLGVDPKAPETSEEVLSRTGTVIEQSQTVGDTTVTLHAAVWDGTDVYLSFEIESPNIPEEVQQHSPLYPIDCRLILREDQWEEYTRNGVKEGYADAGEVPSPEQLEADVQAELEKERMDAIWLWTDGREGNTLTFRPNELLLSRLFTETKRPELTLHLGKIATYVDTDENGDWIYPEPGVVFIEGPFDLTFTLEEPILPIRYDGADVEVTVMDVPLRFTGFQLSATDLTAFFDDPVEPLLPQPGETPTPEEVREIEKAMENTLLASSESVRGFWTEDGKYVDLTNMESSGSGGGSATVERSYPYPIDPATITAVDIAGVRVELGELERLDG